MGGFVQVVLAFFRQRLPGLRHLDETRFIGGIVRVLSQLQALRSVIAITLCRIHAARPLPSSPQTPEAPNGSCSRANHMRVDGGPRVPAATLSRAQKEWNWEDMVQDAKIYRQYAADCARMAGKLNGNDRDVLLKIAQAWEERALEAERQNGKRDKT